MIPLEPADESLTSRSERLLRHAREHLQAAEECIQEVSTFTSLVRRRLQASNLGGLTSFTSSLHNEKSTILDVIHSVQNETLTEQILNGLATRLDNSTTIIHHSVFQWDLLKRGRCFMAMNQVFKGLTRKDRQKILAESKVPPEEKKAQHQLLKVQSKVEVDVLDWGREWVCTRWIQQERLARQLTDNGWCWGYERGDTVDEEEWKDTLVTKYVEKLIGAAKANRAEYEVPKIRLVLPKIDAKNEDIAVFLEQVRNMPSPTTIEIVTADSPYLKTRPPKVEDAIKQLVGDELEKLTPALNLDHTILVDMISDLTHFKLEPQPWQSGSTRCHIQEERHTEGGVMARTLYPLLRGRQLLCTKEGARHFHDMLDVIGTLTEKRRGQLLVPRDGNQVDGGDHGSARDAYASLSIHSLPDDIQIPITIIEEDWLMPNVRTAIDDGALPQVAGDVVMHAGFTESKLSIYLYGWSSGHVTLTSNKEVHNQIKTLVERHRHGTEDKGPRIWKLNVTRNLLSNAVGPAAVQRLSDANEVLDNTSKVEKDPTE